MLEYFQWLESCDDATSASQGDQCPVPSASLPVATATTACGMSVAPPALVAEARPGLQPLCGAACLAPRSGALTAPVAAFSPWPMVVNVEQCSSVAQAEGPVGDPVSDFLSNPQAEVEFWVAKIFASGSSDNSMAIWQDIPMYSQYIVHTPLTQVVNDMARNLEQLRPLQITCEEASESPLQLACTTVLPWAVAVQYGATACFLPAYFLCDMFLTCLSGIVGKHVCLKPWRTTAPDFATRGKFWACPTGDPNASKSPVFNFVLDDFLATIAELKGRFPFQKTECPTDFHTCTGGNHGGFDECMRATGGVCLFVGPGFKPIGKPQVSINRRHRLCQVRGFPKAIGNSFWREVFLEYSH